MTSAPAFIYTIGSRWNSVGAGVGVVEEIDYEGDALIRFADGRTYWFLFKKVRATGVPKKYHLTGSADDQPDNDGWIAWGGGECPVPGDTLIEVRLRNAKSSNGRGRASAWGACWRNDDNPFDIIAYRIVKPAPEEPAAPPDAVCEEISLMREFGSIDSVYGQSVYTADVSKMLEEIKRLRAMIEAEAGGRDE